MAGGLRWGEGPGLRGASAPTRRASGESFYVSCVGGGLPAMADHFILTVSRKEPAQSARQP